jgi:hypothetical protein
MPPDGKIAFDAETQRAQSFAENGIFIAAIFQGDVRPDAFLEDKVSSSVASKRLLS